MDHQYKENAFYWIDFRLATKLSDIISNTDCTPGAHSQLSSVYKIVQETIHYGLCVGYFLVHSRFPIFVRQCIFRGVFIFTYVIHKYWFQNYSSFQTTDVVQIWFLDLDSRSGNSQDFELIAIYFCCTRLQTNNYFVNNTFQPKYSW